MRIDFFICRHGQTDKNVERVWQGCGIDVMLNQVGQKQAQELAEKFSAEHFAVYSSPMLRAVQTARAIARGRDIVIMSDLRECYFGDAEGVSFEETERQYGTEFVHNLLFPTEVTADLCFPNGESKRAVFDRVYACLIRIVSRHTFSYAWNKVCVVCHAGIFSALQFGLGLTDVSYDNCAVLHLQFDTELHKFLQIID